jgi:hypothetical protein
MGFGLVVVGAGVCVVILSNSSSTKYAAAGITAIGAATGGYISKTYLTVQQNATRQMNYYFRQPLVQSYLLQSERLIHGAGGGNSAKLVESLVQANLNQTVDQAVDSTGVSSRRRVQHHSPLAGHAED